MLNKEKENYRLHEKDTGSTAVQIISLRQEIEEQKKHLRENHKDVPVKRSLLKKTASERRLLRYLKGRDFATYQKIVDLIASVTKKAKKTKINK